MKAADEHRLQERFAALALPADGDWGDVRRRARRRGTKVIVAVVALVVALTAAGFAIGGQVVGLFDDHGTPVPLSHLSERDRQLAVFSLCQHIELVSRPGKAPLERCRDGVPKVEEIANDGTTFYWKLTYPAGFTCLASGPVRGFRDANRGDVKIGMLGCNVGSPGQSLVPTPKRPITTDVALELRRGESRARIERATGLAGAGVASVGLVAQDGFVLKTTVKGRTYDFGRDIPAREWTGIAAYSSKGKEVYRERMSVEGPPRPINSEAPPAPPPPLPPLKPLPSGPPSQHGATADASIDVYPSKLVAVHFFSTASDVYRRFERGASVSTASTRGPNLGCGDVAYGAGRWKAVGGGATVPLRQDLRYVLSTRYGGFPSPPYDYCEVSGTYGRYWNDEEGTHELVEVPFTAIGRRYLDERATARDLAYFVRTKKLHRIRLAIHRGEPAPSASGLVRIFGPRLVPLSDRNSTAPAGKIGVWSDGKLIVASELTAGGRRLYVTVRGVFIGANNIRDLSFVF
jgi:hypothetical protein